MPNISIVIPVYNEEKIVASVLDKIFTTINSVAAYEFEVIVVNDYSKDNTLQILQKYEGIKLISNPYNLGYGASLKRGIKEAKGEWIFITDADGTYPVEKLPEFLPYMKDYDMIVGSRTTEKNETPLLRRPAKKFLNSFASWLVNFKIPDLNSGMRMFRREMCLEFWNLYPQRFSFTSTITMAFIKNNYLVKYLPIDYHERIGKSSISPWNFFSFLSLVFRIAFYFQPLKFLTPIIIFIFIIGASKSIFDIWYQNFVGNFSIFLLTLSVIMVFVAMISDLLFKQRK
ncbi:glycosyltransferase family 2 protein [Candidatus Parcubacteria bacterium]|nr:MAG: glycosyltransferase family 2 protein [Candidatus Parcubacteria bacterium]